jgi:rfaE bifunctional protein kinase chain/domain
MDTARFSSIVDRYGALRIGVIGDVCLDRYLEIDPSLAEVSIETSLPVHNITRIRSQPGAAGTVINNLAALGIGRIDVFGWCGLDGEGWELQRALGQVPGVSLACFVASPERHTFAYTKPLWCDGSVPPRELNRLDLKNWTPTPEALSAQLAQAVRHNGPHLDALIIMDQSDRPGTGVVTESVLREIKALAQSRPLLPIIADSRSGLQRFPPIIFKMNSHELSRLLGSETPVDLTEARSQAMRLAKQNRNPVVVTLAADGIVSALPDGTSSHIPCIPVHGPIDVVGAGDSVSANLTAALAAGATLADAACLANAGASVVIHQLGTTGTASVAQIRQTLSLI